MKYTGPRIPVMILMLLCSLVNIEAQQSNKEADNLLEKFLETKSIKYLEKIHESFPDSPYSLFCDAYESLNVNNKQARELAETLVRDYPSFAPGYFALGTVLVDGYKQYDEAIEQFNKAIELNQESNWVYQNRGIAYLAKKDYGAAWQDFDMLVSLKRGYALGYILRGVASHGLGDEEALLADFEIGLQIDYKALVAVYSSLANQAVNKAIESAPENIIYLFARGYANFSNGHYRLASVDFTRAIDLVPGSSDFYKYSGACKLFLGGGKGAQKDLNIALGSNPDDPEIYYYLGVLMNDLKKQPSMACEYLNQAIELDVQNAYYYYERSKSFYQMLNYQAARDDIKMALLYNHRDGDFYALRGDIKMKLENPSEDFCRDYQKAIELGTSYSLKRILKKSCR